MPPPPMSVVGLDVISGNNVGNGPLGFGVLWRFHCLFLPFAGAEGIARAGFVVLCAASARTPHPTK